MTRHFPILKMRSCGGTPILCLSHLPGRSECRPTTPSAFLRQDFTKTSNLIESKIFLTKEQWPTPEISLVGLEHLTEEETDAHSTAP
jgi:hypothetical protein